MKYATVVSALVATTSAASYGTCENVVATVYTDSDCKTESESDSNVWTNNINYGNKCVRPTGQSTYKGYECNTDEMRLNTYSSTDTTCTGSPTSTTVYTWGACQ